MAKLESYHYSEVFRAVLAVLLDHALTTRTCELDASLLGVLKEHDLVGLPANKVDSTHLAQLYAEAGDPKSWFYKALRQERRREDEPKVPDFTESVTLTPAERRALYRVVEHAAMYCGGGEDIMGAITYTGGFHDLPDRNVVPLSRKIEGR